MCCFSSQGCIEIVLRLGKGPDEFLCPDVLNPRIQNGALYISHDCTSVYFSI